MRKWLPLGGFLIVMFALAFSTWQAGRGMAPSPTPMGSGVAGPIVEDWDSLHRVTPDWQYFGQLKPHDFVIDARSVMWITATDGAYSWNLNDGRQKRLSPDSKAYFLVTLAPDGTLWFTSQTDGLAHYDGKTWKTYTTADGLPSNVVYDAQISPSGVVWASTNAGLARYDGATWKTYTTADGLATNNLARVLVARDGDVWVGSADTAATAGLSRFDGSTWRRYTVADGMLGSTLSPLGIDNDGAIWFGTLKAGGVSRFDGKTWTHFTDDQAVLGQHANAMAVGPDGRVWFASEDEGYMSVDKASSWMTYIPHHTYLQFYGGSALGFAPDGTLWTALPDVGIGRYVEYKKP